MKRKNMKKKTENDLFNLMLDIFGKENFESTNIYSKDK